MPLTIADLFTSPDHYLHSFDGSDAIFVPMDRAAYRRSIFLDDRIQPAGNGAMRVPAATLLGMSEERPLQTGWIFHVAHCGSTLLARALDELSDDLVLREPLALRQTAMARDEARLALMLRMLGKRYAGGGASIVKANVPVNFVLPDIALAEPDAPAIFLHYRLEDYLLAILRSANHRTWLRRVTDELAAGLGDLANATDAERAAALWLAQMRLFDAALEAMPQARTLNAEDLFNRPEHVLGRAVGLFQLDPPRGAIERLVGGPLFASYAKNPAILFDNAARIERRQASLADLASELVAADDWIARTAPDVDALMGSLEARALA